MGLFNDFISQTRKPEGILGKMMVNGMNGGHAKMADWGLSHLTKVTPKEIIEIGCGGGRNAGALLEKYPDAKVTAIDYSDVSVAKATSYNQKMIDAGRCVVKQGDASKLDLSEETFDLATAFETIYFWPGLEKCFAEVAKVLKPGGVFMIVNESDGTDEVSLKFEKKIDGMKCYTGDAIEAALKTAGFKKTKTIHHDSKPWITVLAKK
jgi:ubiquinone/menaquinone biosynthesis C-methylase UbiE